MPSTPDAVDGSGDTDGCVERGDPAGAERERARETAFKDSEDSEEAEEAKAPLSRLQRAMSSSLSSLSSLVDFAGIVSAVRDEDTERREGQRAKALDMLRHASMLVQMENEAFMAEFADQRGSTSASASGRTSGRVEEGEVGDAEGGQPEVGSSGSPSGDDDVSSYLPGKEDYAGVWPVFSQQFWVDSIILIVLGGVLGLALVLTSSDSAQRYKTLTRACTHVSDNSCIGYQYAITSAPVAYLTVDNPGYPLENYGYFEGQLWWIGIGAGTGLFVGLLREVLNLRAYLGFVALIQLQDASVVQSAKVVLCSIVSLAGSASVGPEAGFSAIGGGMAALLYKYILKWDKRKDRTRYKYFILAGMAGAFSGFLPAPLLGCLLVWELGLPPMAFGLNQVHFLSLLGMAAVPSSGVFYSLGTKVRG